MIPDACVFTWGYDADVDGFLASASRNTIHQHAANLLIDLADFRDSLEDVGSSHAHYKLGYLLVGGFVTDMNLSEVDAHYLCCA